LGPCPETATFAWKPSPSEGGKIPSQGVPEGLNAVTNPCFSPPDLTRSAITDEGKQSDALRQGRLCAEHEIMGHLYVVFEAL